MDLYILRHGIAVERGTPGFEQDFDRPLTPEGEQKLRRITKTIRQLGLSFDLIISSPYIRARETAEIVANALSLQKQLEFRDTLGADGSPPELIAELAKIKPEPGSLLLVGHEPSLSTIITLLTSGSAQPFLTLKKAGLCKISVDALRVGRCAKLDWLLTPKQMLLMGS